MKVFMFWNVQKVGKTSSLAKRDGISEIAADADVDMWSFCELSTASAPGNIKSIAQAIADEKQIDVLYDYSDAGDGMDSYGIVVPNGGPAVPGTPSALRQIGLVNYFSPAVPTGRGQQFLMGPRKAVRYQTAGLTVYIIHPSPSGKTPTDTLWHMVKFLLASHLKTDKVAILGDFNLDLSDTSLKAQIDKFVLETEGDGIRVVNLASPPESTHKNTSFPIDGAMLQNIRSSKVECFVPARNSPSDHAPILLKVTRL